MRQTRQTQTSKFVRWKVKPLILKISVEQLRTCVYIAYHNILAFNIFLTLNNIATKTDSRELHGSSAYFCPQGFHVFIQLPNICTHNLYSIMQVARLSAELVLALMLTISPCLSVGQYGKMHSN